MTYPDAAMHDTGSAEWRDICLARWICNQPSAELRAGWVGRLVFDENGKPRKGRSQEALEAQVRQQWALRRWWRGNVATPELAGVVGDVEFFGSRPDPIAEIADGAPTPDPARMPAQRQKGQLSLV